VWYLAESLGAAAQPFPRASAEPLALAAPETAALLDASLASAQAAYPDLQIAQIIFPTASNGAFQFHGQDAAILVRPRANGVWTDAADGTVLTVWTAREANAHQRLSEMADPLHFGTFGGIWTKLIWFAFGLAMTGLAVSGVAVYATRLAKAERRAPGLGHALATTWRGMGAWRWVSLAAVFTAFALLPTLFALVARG
jgi:uncharacterized iron-regulated membrane protein